MFPLSYLIRYVQCGKRPSLEHSLIHLTVIKDHLWGFSGGSVVKNMPEMQETQEMQL